MNKALVLALAAPLAFMGCNSDSGSGSGSGGGGSGGGSFSKTPTLEISEANRTKVDEFALYEMIGIESGWTEFLPLDDFDDFDDFGDFGIPVQRQAARMLERSTGRNFNENVTYDCDSGSETIKVSATGVTENEATDQIELAASGSMTLEFISNNCRYDWFDGEYDIDNGTLKITISWTGYNDATDTFGTVNFTFQATNVSYYEYAADDSVLYFEEFDGSLSMTLNDPTYTITMDVFYRGTELEDQGIKVETINSITGSVNDDYPSSGQWIAKGAGSSNVTYTIVPNGVEASVNGGSAQLITWAELYD